MIDLGVDRSSEGVKISLTDAAEILSPWFNHPHGVDFIDDDTIVVCSRRGVVSMFKLPPGQLGGNRYELEPLGIIDSDRGLRAPGSVSVARRHENVYEALICNNRSHTVTRHV
ncbi:MAG: hypothetical protein ACRD9W_17185, partial [Terriglobia bacterium]